MALLPEKHTLSLHEPRTEQEPERITLKSSIHPFVHNTFKVRIPKIITSVLVRSEWSDDVKDALCYFRDNLVWSGDDTTIEILDDSSASVKPHNNSWNSELKNRIESGKTTIGQVDTFFLENYIYRKILNILGYFQEGSRNHLRDPFLPHKADAMSASAMTNFFKVESVFQKFSIDKKKKKKNDGEYALSADTLTAIVKLMLWGNRADLSLSAGKVHNTTFPSTSSSAAHMPTKFLTLADDTEKLLERINEYHNVAIVLDNCGLELATDLVFAEILLSSGSVKSVTLFAKADPVFVSDALRSDVLRHIAWVQSRLGSDCRIAEHARLIVENLGNLECAPNARLKIVAERFFNSGVSFTSKRGQQFIECSKLNGFDLVVFKGDANYRRLLGERRWDASTSFDKIIKSFLPRTNVLALRTIKYPICAGVTADKVLLAKKIFADKWDTSGKCGVIQFSAINE